MKKLRVLFHASLWLLTFVDAANAGFFSAAFAAIGSIATFIGSSFIGKALFGIALNIGISLLSKALQKPATPPGKQPAQPIAGISGTMRVGGLQPLSFPVGTTALAGSLEYIGTWGNAGKTPNAYFVQVISLADLPIEALNSVVVDGRASNFGDPVVGMTALGRPVLSHRKAGVDYLFVKFLDGSQSSADAYLRAKFGDIASRPWTTDMFGAGVPLAIVTARFNRDLMPQPPQLKFVVSGVRFYDVRKDSTAGGSGSQRWNNQATWEFTANPAVIIYNILRGVTWDGNGEWLYGLQNSSARRFPASNWMAAMNACDILVPKAGGGSERKYECGIEVFTDREPLEYVEHLMRACNARMSEVAGTYYILVDSPGASVFAFTDQDVIISEGQTFEMFPGLEQTFNGVRWTFINPAEGWEPADGPARYMPNWEDDDGGQFVADVDFAAVTNSRQGQRLVLPMVKDGRRFRKHFATFPPGTTALIPLDTISWTSARNGYSNKKFVITAKDDLANGCQAIAFQEIDPADYDYDADEDDLPESSGYLGPLETIAQPIVAPSLEPWIVVGDDGKRGPGLKWTWDGDQDDVRGVEWQIRVRATLEAVSPGRVDNVEVGSAIVSHNIRSNTKYQGRIRYIPFTPRETLWSAWLDVTSPIVRLNDVEADLAAVAADVRSYLKARQAEADAAFSEIHRILIDQLTLASSDIVERRQLLRNFGGLSTSFTEEVATRISQFEAMTAQQITITSRLNTTDAGLAALGLTVSNLSSSVSTLGGVVTAQGDALTVVNAELSYLNAGLSATAQAFDTLNAKVVQNAERIETESSRISGVNSRIAGAEGNITLQAEAITTLNTKVDNQGNALAERIDEVSAQVEDATGGIFVKWGVVTQNGAISAKYQLTAKATNDGIDRFAGMYIEVTPSGSQIVFDASKIIFTNGTQRFLPFTFSGGVLKVQNVELGTLRFDRLLSNNSKLDIRGDGSNASITIYD